ncbi:MAG: cytochrome c biogenesis protein CcsA [Pirellulales bacterium]
MGFLALCCYGLSFGRIRTPMYWAGSLLLLFALVWTAYGFYLRIVISGWAPVTNMYETVIFVPFVVGVLGFCFAFAPILAPAWRNAWRLSAVPGTWEATPPSEENLRMMSPAAWSTTNVVFLLPRIALAVLTLLVLSVWPYAAGGRTIIGLLPNVDVGASLPSMNDAMVWIVGLMVLVPTVWYLPRAILAAVVFPLTVLLSMRGRVGELWPQVLRRRAFAISATTVATACWIIAWYSPVLDPNFRPLMPVLRDNFWLLIHVLTIVASYGAGALAWGLGNIALAYYLFGRYRKPALATGVDAALRTGAADTSSQHGANMATSSGGGARMAMRPPEACAALAGYTYKAIQVAVVLLAAGTILGALWADVAWGRFWGWDPKEVWALISLLVYVAILHGRYAGITGNFGLAAGSVLGATAIIMSWYGVNFVLGAGLHSYGFGESEQGQIYVGSCILANWVFVGLAATRYFTMTSGGGPKQPPQPTLPGGLVAAAKAENQEAGGATPIAAEIEEAVTH